MDWLLTAGMTAAADAWGAHVGLSDDIERLRCVLSRVDALVERAEQWRFAVPGVADLLSRLKDAAYDAEDLTDELAAHERQASERSFPLVRDFLRGLVAGTADRARGVRARLEHVSTELERAITALQDAPGNPAPRRAHRETSSFAGRPVVLGRDMEREQVVRLLLNPRHESGGDGGSGSGSDAKRRKKSREGVAVVVAILGMGGVGKTTLAQVVYNDQRVQEHFDLTMWICLPESLDVTRATREIVESATKGAAVAAAQPPGLGNLDSLHCVVRDLVSTKRFLLILDNGWCEDAHEWQTLLAPLRSGCPGSVILVTSRSCKVADAAGAAELVHLSGLPDEAYWELFKQYAFGEEDPVDHPAELVSIGKMIANKLKGSPLAAKTVGGVLSSDMSAKHWSTVMASGLWELEQGAGDILPALRLSYQYLPAHLKRCFVFCSIFPKGYAFRKETVIDMWIAEGFISPQIGIGNRCLKELLSRSFFQQYMFSDISYVMHDLMSDLAQSLSMDECFCLSDEKYLQKIPSTVRHLSVCTKYLELSKFVELGRFTKLRSLLIFGMFGQELSHSLDLLFGKLSNIRLLVLRECAIKELPGNIGNLKHLRYFDISYTKIRRLPDSVCQLSNLQVLNVQHVPLDNHPKGLARLTNLRKCYMNEPITSVISNLSNLTSLQSSLVFDIKKGQGHRVAELKDMTQLTEILHMKNLQNIVKDDAPKAKLNTKEHLRQLVFEWFSSGYGDADINAECSTGGMILELLQPPPNLECLKFKYYGGIKTPSWLQDGTLCCLHELTLSNCLHLTEITTLPSSLRRLRIVQCRNLRSLEECLKTQRLQRINAITIINCTKLALLPVEIFQGFTSLNELGIDNCPELPLTRKLTLPPSIEGLFLKSCGYVDGSLPNCLFNLHSLTSLVIYNCPNLLSLPSEVVSQLRSLQGMFVDNCSSLESLGGLHSLSLIITLHIVNCPRLTNFDPPMFLHIVEGRGMQKLECLTISSTPLLWMMARSPLPALRTLFIYQSTDSLVVHQGSENKLSVCFPSVQELFFQDCGNLLSLPEELHMLSSLQFLRIFNCPKIQSLPPNGLPISLKTLSFENCHTMLEEQLKKLEISYCTAKSS